MNFNLFAPGLIKRTNGFASWNISDYVFALLATEWSCRNYWLECSWQSVISTVIVVIFHGSRTNISYKWSLRMRPLWSVSLQMNYGFSQPLWRVKSCCNSPHGSGCSRRPSTSFWRQDEEKRNSLFARQSIKANCRRRNEYFNRGTLRTVFWIEHLHITYLVRIWLRGVNCRRHFEAK